MERSAWAAFAVILCLLGAVSAIGGLRFPELEVNYVGRIRELSPSEVSEEFDRSHSLPEEVIVRRAILDPLGWAKLPRRRDKRTGWEFFFEKFRYGKLGDIHLIALMVNAPVEAGLQAALDCSLENFGFERREVVLKVRDGRIRGVTGSILPGTLYRGLDELGNELLGYRILLEMKLPRPISDRKFILRVLNRFMFWKGRRLIVSEWYQAEGEFKYMRGCDTFYPIDDRSHLLTVKFNGDIGGIGGGLGRALGSVFDLDFIAESYLKRIAFGIKRRAEVLSRGER